MKLTAQRGAVPIKLDRDRILFFSMSSTWLLIEKYGLDFATKLYAVSKTGSAVELKLKSMDALAFFLWAGLQDDAIASGENLDIDVVKDFVTPFSVRDIFNKLVLALTRTVSTPAEPGKAEAASSTAKPAARKKAAKVSTLKMRNGLRQVR